MGGFLTFLEGSRSFDVILNNRIIGTIGMLLNTIGMLLNTIGMLLRNNRPATTHTIRLNNRKQ